MKKFIPLVIVGFLILCGPVAGALPFYITNQNHQRWKETSSTVSSNGDEIDQSMTAFDGVMPLGRTNIFGYYANLSVAQSFIPQKEILTRLQFLMARNSTTLYPCYLAVRDNLIGENLTIITVEPNKFPIVNGTPTQEEMTWVEFDFKDITITPGHTYYLALYTANITENYYWIAGNGTNVYQNGTVFLSTDDGKTWFEFTNADCCFKTFGINNEAPETPAIDGQTLGIDGVTYKYSFVAIDSDGDNISYCINWGDNTYTNWTGPFPSGEIVNISHSWMNEGNYDITVKAKDIFDAESDWSKLFPITIYNRPITPAFLIGGFPIYGNLYASSKDLVRGMFIGLYIGPGFSIKFYKIDPYHPQMLLIDNTTKKGVLLNFGGSAVVVFGKFMVTEIPYKNFDSLFSSHNSPHSLFYLERRLH